MDCITIYNTLVELKDDPEAFNAKLDEIWEQIYQSLGSEERIRKARQQKWQFDAQLRHYKDPQARLNKAIEMFWQGVNTFHQSLTEPSKIIAKSQDGSKVVVLPIDRKEVEVAE